MESIPRHFWRTSLNPVAAAHHYQHHYPYGHLPWTAIVIVVIAVAALGLVTRWRR